MMKTMMTKLLLIATLLTTAIGTTTYASGTCAVKGCYKSTVYGGSYCKNHTCSKYGCKNYSQDGTYCEEHQKKSSTGSKSSGKSKGSTGSDNSSSFKQCIVSGCHNSRSGGSCYCSKHKCSQSGCTNKAVKAGYCDRHRQKASDPYDVYEYDDPEDFYYDWAEDFDGYEDAEDYWDEAWN